MLVSKKLKSTPSDAPIQKRQTILQKKI